MPAFRYPQYCPLARAAEILGQRWTLLIVRELLLGPRRFSDLRSPLSGVSPSVLAERLAFLEARGLVMRREHPPPAPATLYELTDDGRALEPAVLALARWGARFLDAPQPGDHFEADWLRLGLLVFARRKSTPARAYAIRIAAADREIAFRVCGGAAGTRVEAVPGPADVTLRTASPVAILRLAAGALAPEEAIASGRIEVDGERAALADFARLFEMRKEAPDPGAGVPGASNQKGSQQC